MLGVPTLTKRFGTFFILLGAVLLLLFVVSTQAEVKNGAGLLLGGLTLTTFGIFLRMRAPKKPLEPSHRFRILRRHKKDEETDGSDQPNC